jgi:hypothetical protein
MNLSDGGFSSSFSRRFFVILQAAVFNSLSGGGLH